MPIESTTKLFDAASLAWQPNIIRLRYSLSYVKVFELTFRALQDVRPFDPARPVVREPQPPLFQIPPEYDVVVARHQLLAAHIPVIQRLTNVLCYAPHQLPHYYTDLSAQRDQPFAMMSSRTRSTLARKVRQYKAFSGTETCWRVYRRADELLEYHKLARQVSSKTYQERLFDSGLPDTKTFIAEMLALAERDLVRGFILFHGDRPVAYLYTPAPDGFLVHECLGYDPGYAEHSPGTVLQYLAIQHLHAEQRFPIYYWGTGHSQTKEIFATNKMLGADIYYFRPTVRNRIAVYGHHGTDRLATVAGRTLDRLNLKQRVRRWLRR